MILINIKYTAILLTSLFLLSLYSRGQVTIGSGNPPEKFSALQLDTGKGGLRLNQLTKEQKDALTALIVPSKKEQAKGLTIYDLETKTVQYWDGEKWAQVVGTINAGEEGQFLKANSTDLPEWITLKIPEVKEGDYYLTSSIAVKDDQGVVLGYKPDDTDTYSLDDPLTAEWVVLDGLTTTIKIPEVINPIPGKDLTRVAVMLQAGGQIASGERSQTYRDIGTRPSGSSVTQYTAVIKNILKPAVTFAIGIFVGDDTNGYKLKIVRPTIIEASGGGMTFSLYTVMGTISDLPTGLQTLKIAVRRRESINMQDGYPWGSSVFPEAGKRFSFGRGIPEATNVNPFMTQSSLKIEVYALNTD